MATEFKDSVRIGCGSAYAGDPIELAVNLVRGANLNYLGMDCLAERTLALAQLRRREDPRTGYDSRLPEIVSSLLPAAMDRGVKIVTNMGAANPRGAVDYIHEHGHERLRGLRIGLIEGDDVLDYVTRADPLIEDTGKPVSEMPGEVVSANAYVGAEPVVAALRGGAQLVVGGRLADPSLYVGPIAYELGWALDDWHHLGIATSIGHLLECGTHVTGGNFSDPPFQPIEDWSNPSQPFADVRADGSAVIGKLDGSGGRLSVETCKVQLGYEIHDPGGYLTPDVTGDFRNVQLRPAAHGVAVTGATGRARPDSLKALIGIDEGYIGEALVSYAGPGALGRAEVARDLVRAGLAPLLDDGSISELRVDLLGIDALIGPSRRPAEPPWEVHVRAAGRCRLRAVADRIGGVIEYVQVYGPAGTAGHRRYIRPVIAMYGTLIPRSEVNISVDHFQI
jgi:hypothetical protein